MLTWHLYPAGFATERMQMENRVFAIFTNTASATKGTRTHDHALKDHNKYKYRINYFVSWHYKWQGRQLVQKGWPPIILWWLMRWQMRQTENRSEIAPNQSGFRALSQSRLTVKGASLENVIMNYIVLQQLSNTALWIFNKTNLWSSIMWTMSQQQNSCWNKTPYE